MAPHSGEMVKDALKDKGMTQIELGRRIGRDQTLISRYLSGQIEISEETARAIAEELEIDFQKLRRQLQLDKLNRRVGRLRAGFKRILGQAEEIDIPFSDEPIFVVGHVGITEEAVVVRAIPLLNSISASADDRSKEGTQPYILPPGVQVDTERAFALKISGENMTDDEVDEGDIIVVDPDAEVQDDDKVLVILKGEPALRRIYRTGDTVVLQWQGNHNAPVVFLSQEDDFKIVGRVVLYTKLFIR
jgi:SOS-response transcriptional repressor LexA